MYANSYGRNSTPIELSNNPFVNDPSNPHTRFPDISGSSGLSSPPLGNQPQQGYGGYQPQQQPYGQQQGQFANQQYGGYQSQPTVQPWGQQQLGFSPGGGSIGSQPTGRGFQPSSSFGQQLVSAVDGQQQQFQQPYATGYQNPGQTGSYGGQQQQYPGQQYPHQTGYQQQLQNAQYLSEFDPYNGQQRQMNGYNNSGGAGGSASGFTGGVPGGQPHPRDWIRTHKTELEAWDVYTWRQMFNSCDVLKAVWGARRDELGRYVAQLGPQGAPGLFGGGGYGGYNPEAERWRQMHKDADSNHDIIAACVFQLHEVHDHYRQSGDAAGKRRVRESCNAALSSLPDWPQPLQ